jgi:hypothetical protein
MDASGILVKMLHVWAVITLVRECFGRRTSETTFSLVSVEAANAFAIVSIMILFSAFFDFTSYWGKLAVSSSVGFAGSIIELSLVPRLTRRKSHFPIFTSRERGLAFFGLAGLLLLALITTSWLGHVYSCTSSKCQLSSLIVGDVYSMLALSGFVFQAVFTGAFRHLSAVTSVDSNTWSILCSERRNFHHGRREMSGGATPRLTLDIDITLPSAEDMADTVINATGGAADGAKHKALQSLQGYLDSGGRTKSEGTAYRVQKVGERIGDAVIGNEHIARALAHNTAEAKSSGQR